MSIYTLTMNLITRVKNSLPRVILDQTWANSSAEETNNDKSNLLLWKVWNLAFWVAYGGPIGARVPLSGSIGSTFSGLVVDIIRKLQTYAWNKKNTETDFGNLTLKCENSILYPCVAPGCKIKKIFPPRNNPTQFQSNPSSGFLRYKIQDSWT